MPYEEQDDHDYALPVQLRRWLFELGQGLVSTQKSLVLQAQRPWLFPDKYDHDGLRLRL